MTGLVSGIKGLGVFFRHHHPDTHKRSISISNLLIHSPLCPFSEIAFPVLYLPGIIPTRTVTGNREEKGMLSAGAIFPDIPVRPMTATPRRAGVNRAGHGPCPGHCSCFEESAEKYCTKREYLVSICCFLLDEVLVNWEKSEEDSPIQDSGSLWRRH